MAWGCKNEQEVSFCLMDEEPWVHGGRGRGGFNSVKTAFIKKETYLVANNAE